jgi:tRNA pseudouridine55 synthase
LYEYAREGIEIERTARQVTIHQLEVVTHEGSTVTIDVECSKGTYVRVLAEEIGTALGCGAHLSALRRTRVGALSLERSVTLEALENMAPAVRREWLMPVDALLAALPRIELDETRARRFQHGNPIDLGGAPGRTRVYGPDGRLLGLADLDEHGALNPRRLLATAAETASTDN